MKLYYYRDPHGNFGDDLNPWLWSRLISDLLDERCAVLFVGIGTLLDHRIPAAYPKVVFGSGVGYGALPELDESWQISCVRGPLSAKALKLPKSFGVTDPAVMVRDFVSAGGKKTYRVSFMPHHITKFVLEKEGLNIRELCDMEGTHYIDPCRPVDDVLLEIQGSELLITEAMHGAIVSDTLRVPWVPVQILDHILEFKWLDWCGSLELEYEPLRCPEPAKGEPALWLSRFVRQAARGGRPRLSEERLLTRALARLHENLDQVRSERKRLCHVSWAGPDVPSGPVSKDRLGVAKSAVDERPGQIDWHHQIHVAKREVVAIIPVGDPFILVDDYQWGTGGVIAGRVAVPFLERDGRYWGPPVDDATAIRELERLRRAGASHIAFAWPAFWWLDHYTELHRHLRSAYRCVLDNGRLVVFDLRSGA